MNYTGINPHAEGYYQTRRTKPGYDGPSSVALTQWCAETAEKLMLLAVAEYRASAFADFADFDSHGLYEQIKECLSEASYDAHKRIAAEGM